MAVLSLMDSQFLEDPYPAITEFRSVGVVPNVDHGGYWLLDSSEMWDVVRDPQFANDPALADPAAPITAVLAKARLSFLYMDPPEHTRLRGLVSREFTPRSVAAMEASIREIGTEILDQLPDRGEIDVVASFADVLPLVVMAELMGVEPELRQSFREWTMMRVRNTFNPAKVDSLEFREATRHLTEYFAAAVRDRRLEPRADLISKLAGSTNADGTGMDDIEIIELMVLLLGAGISTTADLIGNLLHALLTHPEELRAVRAEPDLIPVAVEETLRFDSPALSVRRIVTEPVQLCGETLAPGSWLSVMICGLGRDPSINPDPDVYRLDRSDRQHIAFGGGAHHCVGAHLARLEAKEALGLILDRYPTMELLGRPGGVSRRCVPAFRGFSRMEINVDSR